MSADNEIIILSTKKCSGAEEFRVKMCYGDEYERITSLNTRTQNEIKRIFGECEVLHSLEEADRVALKLEKEVSYVEYGICLVRVDFAFPESFPLGEAESGETEENIRA
jgi:hypothetical protein